MAQQIIIKGTPVVAANEVLVADSNSKIPAVDGSAVTAIAGGTITGTIPTARLDTGTTANKLVVVGASGLPACDGSLLTGIVSHTTSASDPTVSTNPATGVGAEWINSTSGKQFICTDATAGENVWTCSGGGSGNIQALQFGGHGGGQNYGYVCGGYYPNVKSTQSRYSYATDGNSVAVTSLTVARYASYGAQSETHGYTLGSANAPTQAVEKTTFASTTTQVNLGNLLRWICTGPTATNSSTHLYEIGSSIASQDNGIQKMAFASEVTFTEVGDAYNMGLGTDLAHGSGHASYTHGYRAGGHSAGPGSQQTSKIEKWTFAADANSAEVANLFRGIDTGISGASSITHGYMLGGHGSPQTEIDKFPFATDSDSTDVGDLHTGEAYASATSSLTHGYMAGGGHPQINNIQKVSFTTDGNATDVGDTTDAAAYVSGFHD